MTLCVVASCVRLCAMLRASVSARLLSIGAYLLCTIDSSMAHPPPGPCLVHWRCRWCTSCCKCTRRCCQLCATRPSATAPDGRRRQRDFRITAQGRGQQGPGFRQAVVQGTQRQGQGRGRGRVLLMTAALTMISCSPAAHLEKGGDRSQGLGQGRQGEVQVHRLLLSCLSTALCLLHTQTAGLRRPRPAPSLPPPHTRARGPGQARVLRQVWAWVWEAVR